MRIRKKKLLLLLLLILTAALEVPSTGIREYRTSNSDCLNGSLSVWQKARPSVSLLDCFMSSRSFRLGSVGVVQRSKQDASCALFRFSQVCQLLNLKSISSFMSRELKSDCDILVDSEYDAIAANKHFDAVWVGDRGPLLENLVCGSDGQKNPMRSSNVKWTSEGARMDGVSSQLWVDDPSGLDFTGSFTWAIQLKRVPKASCFLELAKCADSSQLFHQFWEFSFVSGVDRSLYYNFGLPIAFQTGSVLTADAQQYIIAGVAYHRSANETKVFLERSFLNTTMYQTIVSSSFDQNGACIKVGWRGLNDGVVNGVIRAVAVSGSVLPAEVIRQLFESS